MPNDDLIIDVLAHIEADPASWDQNWWGQRTSCGTAYCFAGHACLLSGVKLHFFDNGLADYTDDGDYVGVRAAALLGLDDEQRHDLFSAITDLGMIYRITARITGLDESVLRDKVKDRVHSG